MVMPTSPAVCAAAGRPVSIAAITAARDDTHRLLPGPVPRAPLRRIREAPAGACRRVQCRGSEDPCSARPSAPVSASPWWPLAATVSLSAQQMQPTPNRRAGRRRRPVRPHGHPRHHRDRRHRRAAARPDGRGGRAGRDPRGVERRLPEGADRRSPAGQGHQGVRRHRDVPDARLRRRARALRRRPGRQPRVRLQAVAGPRRDHGARRAVRLDGLGPGAARAVGQEPDRRAADLLLSPAVQRRGLGPHPAADARDGARVGALRRPEGRRRPEARRPRPRDHGGAARRSEEAQARLDRAPRPDGRRPA